MNINAIEEHLSKILSKIDTFSNSFSENVNALQKEIDTSGWTEELKKKAIMLYTEKIEFANEIIRNLTNKQFETNLKAGGFAAKALGTRMHIIGMRTKAKADIELIQDIIIPKQE